MSDPSRVADIICTYVIAPLAEMQALLATLDPVARLERVEAMMAVQSGSDRAF
jgi:ATP-dependent protease La (Lon)-like substrate-binding protein